MNKQLFLHCSDLHLGCTPNHLEIRYEDFFISFKQLLDDAINHNCKYLLISGDLFHLKVINSKTLLKTLELLEYALQHDMKIFAIEGNHDKAFYVDENSWLHFLHKKGYITLLKHKIVEGQLTLDEESIYEDENIRIIGIGYLGSTTAIYLKDIEKKIKQSNKFTVLMLHAAINRLCGEEMGDINIEELAPISSVVDYVALGHIHARYEYHDRFYNPGSIENIRIKDGKKSNKKGYYIVAFDGKEKDVQFIVSKQRKIHNLNIKLGEGKTLEEIEHYLLNYEYDLEKDSIVELTLYGKVSFNPYLINFDNLKNYLVEKYQLIYIDVNNLINIMNNDISSNNIIDIKIIEEEAVRNYITINYPDIKSVEDMVNKIHSLKEAIIEDKDYDLIIKNMIDKGEIL